MAALLKKEEEDGEQWSQPVSNEGLQKLAQSIAKPKKPNEALKRLMSNYKGSK